MSLIENKALVQQYSSLELLARQVVEGFITGLHKSPFHGFSVEFAEHRLYNTGESTRHIDWKLYARTEKLFIKNYEEETNLRCQIILDHSPSMYFPDDGGDDKISKLRFSVYAAAAIMELLKKQRDAAGLSIFGEGVDHHFGPKSNNVHRALLMRTMEDLLETQRENNSRTHVAHALHEIAERIHKRSLVIIFSDMFENGSEDDMEQIFSALQHLRHNKHEVILFHVFDKNLELDFEFENRPYRFIDKETGEELKVNPMDVKSSYVEKTKSFFRELKLKCGQYKIDLVEADINQGFNEILLPYLIKRSKMP